MPVEWDGIKINLLDTPGYADFVGELRAGLRAADAALFVVSASDGVDGSTCVRGRSAAPPAVGMPRAIVITHLEAARADFEEMTRDLRGGEAFGGDDLDAGRASSCRLLTCRCTGRRRPDGHAPVTRDSSGCCRGSCFDYASGERESPEPGEEQVAVARRRPASMLIEGIISRARTRPSWSA